MKYVQNVRGKWIDRVTVPDDLREIIGQRELIEKDLPPDARGRDRIAVGAINRFPVQIEEARETLEARKNAPDTALTAAAKAHYRSTLEADEAKRAAMPTTAQMKAEHDSILNRIDSGHISIDHGPAASSTRLPTTS